METSPWLSEAMRFALRATASSSPPWLDADTSNLRATAGHEHRTDPDDPGRDPRFRKIVEAILFSRRFCATYNVVMVAVLVGLTVWHWSDKLWRRLAKRRVRESNRPEVAEEERRREEETWSSSSSTVSGNATPPDTVTKVDESSPLLASTRSNPRPTGVWRLYFVLKAFLSYQPSPVLLVNKNLPSNGTSLFILAWLALVVFYTLYHMPLSFMYLFAFADRCGIIFIVNLPLLYLLAAKNQPLKFLTGYSYEGLNILHRRVGEIMCLEALLHTLGMFGFWYGLLRHLGFTLTRFLFSRVVLFGLFAFIAYELIYFTSLGSFRQRWYEIFLGLHIVLQTAGLVFLWVHHHAARPYVGLSFAIFLVDRIFYRLWLKSSTHPATLEVLDDGETLLISANWTLVARNAWCRPKNMKTGWKANDHVFISVPSLSRKHVIQSHPFTIFSAAPTISTDAKEKHAWFSLLIRAQGSAGFTRALLKHAQLGTQTRIRLDGPYGSSHALDLLSLSNTAILVAGGSGIAVAYPLLYALLAPSSDLADPEGRPVKPTRKVKLLWITHSPTHRLWIPSDKLKELQDWGLEVHEPPPTVLAGRPDVGVVLRGWVDREVRGTGVVVSGPEGLVRDVRNVCAGCIREGRDVGLAVEKFGW